MVDLVEVEYVSVHVTSPGECVPTNRASVGFRLPHDGYLDSVVC